jgi:hypothetical protein
VSVASGSGRPTARETTLPRPPTQPSRGAPEGSGGPASLPPRPVRGQNRAVESAPRTSIPGKSGDGGRSRPDGCRRSAPSGESNRPILTENAGSLFCSDHLITMRSSPIGLVGYSSCPAGFLKPVLISGFGAGWAMSVYGTEVSYEAWCCRVDCDRSDLGCTRS